MSLWIGYLVENKSVKELIRMLEEECLDASLAMNILDVSAKEATKISEKELEDVIASALEIKLQRREISEQSLDDICESYQTNAHKLVYDGIIIHWNNKFYDVE